MMCPTSKPVLDPKYLAHLRELPCAVCGGGPCEPAHQRLIGGGTGSKPGDNFALPCCFECHRIVEHGVNGGILTLWKTRGGMDLTKADLRDHVRQLCDGYYTQYLDTIWRLKNYV